jgi:hypothetical protein
MVIGSDRLASVGSSLAPPAVIVQASCLAPSASVMVRVTAFNDIECLRRIAFTPFSGVCCMKEFDLNFPVRMHGGNDGLLIVTAYNDMVSYANNHFKALQRLSSSNIGVSLPQAMNHCYEAAITRPWLTVPLAAADRCPIFVLPKPRIV